MNTKLKYYILMLLMSTIWAAEADYNLKNLNGTANLNLCII